MTLGSLAIGLVAAPAVLMLVSYLGYPLVLMALARRRHRPVASEPTEWPAITISVPVYNEERSIAATLENLLATDYPPERRHILVVSDASTDRTDQIVKGFAHRGIRLVRLPTRGGKTAAENEAGHHLIGDIVINIDATVRIPPKAIKLLVRAFEDPAVGVVSGRDVSVGSTDQELNQDESSYVGYEMWVRRLETQCGSIVGASGCLFAIRRSLFDTIFPEALSRDFASPLIAREAGYRSVSVDDAICLVPRTKSLRAEYRRKVRTMTRGLETLWYKRALLNPIRFGRFAVFLAFHKLLRWLVFLSLAPAAIGLLILAVLSPWGMALLALVVAVIALGAWGYYWPAETKAPRLLTLAGFVVSVHLAGLVAWFQALRGELNPVWEPTRRG